MAVAGALQALIAAFFSGILFNAASAALVINIRELGSLFYREGLRLALILFLVSSLCWAFVEFLATLIDPSATPTCQAAVVFSCLFDQFGRAFIEQYLVWAVQKGEAKTADSVLPQILVFGRFFFGIGYAALTRVQFKPTCVPLASIRGISISVIALDGVIIGLLAVRAFSNGAKGDGDVPRAANARTKAARLVGVGVAGWWATSITSLLALDSIDLFYRTAFPVIGLTILIGLVTVLSQTLVASRKPPRRPDSPVLQGARDLSSSDSTGYPPSRYEDLKGINPMTISASASKRETNRGLKRNDDGTLPVISRPTSATGSIADTDHIREQDLPAVPPLPLLAERNWKAMARSKAKAGIPAISNPILLEDEISQNPLKNIATVELAEAARSERMRREKGGQRNSQLVAKRPAPRAPSPPPDVATLLMRPEVAEELQRSESVNSKETSSGLSVRVNASTTGTQLLPGPEAITHRSPRQLEPPSSVTSLKTIRPGGFIRIPIRRPQESEWGPSTVSPQAEHVETYLQRHPVKALTEARDQQRQTVMFVNKIVYDNPNTVGDIIREVSKMPQAPDSGDSVLNRPRPISRKRDKDRQVFPAEISHHHTRSRSGGTTTGKSILQLVPSSPTGLPALPRAPQMCDAVKWSDGRDMIVATSSGPGSTRDVRGSGASRSTTVRTSSILGVAAAVESPECVRKTSNTVEELGDSWLRSTGSDAGDDSVTGSVATYVRRKSSSILPNDESICAGDARLSIGTRKSQYLSNQFHHRVGEECPTFSTRGDRIRFRKTPPPTPLLLNGHKAKRMKTVQPAEPSPLESPTAVYEAIQAQLRDIDRAPQATTTSNAGQGLALLDNLEQELSRLERQWLTAHRRLDRDSTSSVPSQDSRPVSEDIRGKLALPPGTSLQGSAIIRPDSPARNDDMPIVTPPTPTLWTAPALRTNQQQPLTLWLPGTRQKTVRNRDNTQEPPEVRFRRRLIAMPALTIESTRLWQKEARPMPKEQQQEVGLWQKNPQSTPTELQRDDDLLQREPQSAPTEPAQEYGLSNSQTLISRPVRSKGWTRPATVRASHSGLFSPQLPDVVEEPQPLPGSRESLGLFRSPWGECTEHVSIFYPSGQCIAITGFVTTTTTPEFSSFFSPSDDDDDDDSDSEYEEEEEEEEEPNGTTMLPRYYGREDGDKDDHDQDGAAEIAIAYEASEVEEHNQKETQNFSPPPAIQIPRLWDQTNNV
ncbi:hypothetical protein F5Y17DRAFT_460035 [Xylariaceae sp. FL0594]|nr:hypothetical protein F5Y17DRAFT_460035 [Xylariaceae sp. FL0594]